jgi:hypothetical protein
MAASSCDGFLWTGEEGLTWAVRLPRAAEATPSIGGFVVPEMGRGSKSLSQEAQAGGQEVRDDGTRTRPVYANG